MGQCLSVVLSLLLILGGISSDGFAAEAGNFLGIDCSSGRVAFLYEKGAPDRAVLKEDLKLFLTGIAFPLKELVVDLNISNLSSDVIEPALEGTELGRIFLESDLKLITR